jgi:hypothetical protein
MNKSNRRCQVSKLSPGMVLSIGTETLELRRVEPADCACCRVLVFAGGKVEYRRPAQWVRLA